MRLELDAEDYPELIAVNGIDIAHVFPQPGREWKYATRCAAMYQTLNAD
jgi:hypothetical protein